ncbi:MAG: dihydrofolate reductase [Candidatus Saccharimonas sp.]
MEREMIVAYGKYDRAIGQDGQMPWGNTLKQDLRRFRQLTLGKSVIMGRHTFESIGRPLPGRHNIVVSSHAGSPEGVRVVPSLTEAYAIASVTPIVIGGGRLYEEALPYTDTIFTTEIDGHFPDADTFFPEIPPEPVFMEAPGARQHMRPDVLGGYAYEFAIYLRHLDRELVYESFV